MRNEEGALSFRLSAALQLDYVYVLKQGRVVAEGTFAYLREHSAVFQELWKHQEETVKQAG